MAYNMLGTGKGAATAKPRPEPKSTTPKVDRREATALKPKSVEDTMAMNRIKRLTTKPDEWSPHDTHMHHILDVMSHGVNALEDRGDHPRKDIAELHGGLHRASLHLNAHVDAHRNGDYGQAAGHLELAAKELKAVGSTLNNKLGSHVTHLGDNQQYPLGFLKSHADTLANHYRIKVAGINGPTAIPKAGKSRFQTEDNYRLGPNKADQELAAAKSATGNLEKLDTSPEATVRGRVTHLSEIQYPQPHTLPAALREKGPTNTNAVRALSPAEEKLASLPPKAPKMSAQAHYNKARSDLETKGKIHKDQLEALRGKTTKDGTNVLNYLYETTGVPNPAKAGSKMSRTAPSPAIRDREVK
jgi:hypothetical protein